MAVTGFLFLQRLVANGIEPLPWDAVLRELGALGAQVPVEGGLEIGTPPDEVADLVLVVGNASEGVQCIAFVGPAYDEALRTLVLRLLQDLGCVAFDDAISRAYVSARHAGQPLPAVLAAETATVLRRVSQPLQLWPDWTETVLEREFRYAVLGPVTVGGDPLVQFFDAKDPDQDIFEISVATRPAAWNAGTVAAFRMLQARVDRVRDAHPEYGVAYRYADPETPLREAEFARGLAPLRHPVTTIAPWIGTARTTSFATDRELFGGFAAQASAATQSAQEEFSLALDGSAASVEQLSVLLDRLHEDCAQRGFGRDHGTWVMRAGSYLSLVVARGIGGQLGFTTTDRARVPCVRMHTGRLQFPVLRVLDHIVNGSTDSVLAWFADTARADASRTPREADWVCNIPGYCDILRGRADLKGGSLPLADQIPRERLDFSLESLHFLDRFLAQVRTDPTVAAADLGPLILMAGAYLGEVVRSQQRFTWLWVPYDDFVVANPDFAARRPRQLEVQAFLDSPEQSCYPLAHVAAVLAGEELGCHRFAMKVLRPDEEPLAAPAAAPPPPPPKVEPAKPARPKPAGGVSTLTRWVLRAAHVCLLAPILYFALAAAGPMAPVAGITRLWSFAFLFYVAGGVLYWRDKRR